MHLRKHDLLQMNDEWLKKLPAERLLEVSKRLLDDVKELHDRLNQNPDNSSRPPTSQAPWERASDAEVDQDSPSETDPVEAADEGETEKRGGKGRDGQIGSEATLSAEGVQRRRPASSPAVRALAAPRN
jgi:transposase